MANTVNLDYRFYLFLSKSLDDLLKVNGVRLEALRFEWGSQKQINSYFVLYIPGWLENEMKVERSVGVAYCVFTFLFHHLYSTDMLCILLLHLIKLLHSLFLFFFVGFLLLSPKGSVTGSATPRLGVSAILQCISYHVHASYFRLLLLPMCSNKCVEALVVYRNYLLNRLVAL